MLAKRLETPTHRTVPNFAKCLACRTVSTSQDEMAIGLIGFPSFAKDPMALCKTLFVNGSAFDVPGLLLFEAHGIDPRLDTTAVSDGTAIAAGR